MTKLPEAEFDARLAEVLTKESGRPLLTWWLSFADATQPKGDQFRGVILVDACRGITSARLRLKQLGVPCPAGEIRGFGFAPDDGPEDQVRALASLPRGVLLSKAQLEAVGLRVGPPQWRRS